jgi:hypothetical protein
MLHSNQSTDRYLFDIKLLNLIPLLTPWYTSKVLPEKIGWYLVEHTTGVSAGSFCYFNGIDFIRPNGWNNTTVNNKCFKLNLKGEVILPKFIINISVKVNVIRWCGVSEKYLAMVDVLNNR